MSAPSVAIRRAEPPDFSPLFALLQGKARFDGGAHLRRATREELRSAFFGTPPRR